MLDSQHIVPVRTYLLVFLALMVLLALTVACAQIEHGALNLAIGLSIAVSKALLIVLFFMHVRGSSFVIRIAVAAGFLWLAILLTLTLSDYLTRTEPAAVTRTSQEGEAREQSSFPSRLKPGISGVNVGQ